MANTRASSSCRGWNELKITGTFPPELSLPLPWVDRAPYGAHLYLEEVKMASNEFHPAGMEGNAWQSETGSAMAPPGWVGTAYETAGFKLDDFLYAGQARSHQSGTSAALESRASDSLAPKASTDCPHCAAPLSAVELKMERCLACGQGLHVRSATEDGISANQPLTIGI